MNIIFDEKLKKNHMIFFLVIAHFQNFGPCNFATMIFWNEISSSNFMYGFLMKK